MSEKKLTEKEQKIQDGLEKIQEGFSLMDEYDMELVLEETDDFTREDIIKAYELIKEGILKIKE